MNNFILERLARCADVFMEMLRENGPLEIGGWRILMHSQRKKLPLPDISHLQCRLSDGDHSVEANRFDQKFQSFVLLCSRQLPPIMR